MKRGTLKSVAAMLGMVSWLTANGRAQFNSGSTGADGALTVAAGVTTNIYMSDHPTGIYTSVGIANNATVNFTPNAGNTPVVWLVQNSCVY
jgi:hypothetical protein